MKTYMAGSFKQKEAVAQWAAWLAHRRSHLNIVSTWHKRPEDDKEASELSWVESRDIAKQDVLELQEASHLLVLVGDYMSPGKWWEAGYMAALDKPTVFIRYEGRLDASLWSHNTAPAYMQCVFASKGVCLGWLDFLDRTAKPGPYHWWRAQW